MASVSPPIKTTSLEKILSQNRDIDWRSFDLYSDSTLASLSWKGIGKQKGATIDLLKGYQRLVRLLDSNDTSIAIPLLQQGIHSALQIAGMPQTQFFSQFGDLWTDSTESADAVYQRAVQVRSKLLLEYMKIKQNNHSGMVSPTSNSRKA